MKTVSAPLLALINTLGGGVPVIECDLYTFTLQDGSTLLYTNADFAVTAPDNTIWDAPKIDGSGQMWTAGMKWTPTVVDPAGKVTGHWKVGVDVDTRNVGVAPRPVDLFTGAAFPDTINGVPWLKAARLGALDNADLIVSRAYFAAMPTHPIPAAGAVPVGTLIIFRGMGGQVDAKTSKADIAVNDYKALLSQQIPANVYQPGCRHRLFDSRCGLNPAGFTRTGAAGVGSTSASIVAAVAAPAGSGTFVLGTLTMTSGANAGISRPVSAWDAGGFALLYPFPYAIAAADTFSVVAGCRKTTADCTAFGNLVNFGGEPFVPLPEVAFG